ncbi:hypothetical protein [Streptomyces sp. NBC_00454]|uniref:hypothetical protein n=1 Tax=Streptomyces sp. NBC_00454 TaxID=2975747 RepID=UPI0030E39FA5
MSKARRIIGMAAATALAGALPVLAAAPAQATSGDCTNYMRNLGYVVGPNVISACDQGTTGFFGEQACYGILVSRGVRPDHANEACYQASRD